MSWFLEWKVDSAHKILEIHQDAMFRKMMVIVSSRMNIMANTMHMRRFEVNAIDSNLLELKLWINKDVWIRIIHSFCFIFDNSPDLQSVVSVTSKMGFMESISYSNADGWWKHIWKLKCLRDLPSTESSFDWMHSKGWNSIQMANNHLSPAVCNSDEEHKKLNMKCKNNSFNWFCLLCLTLFAKTKNRNKENLLGPAFYKAGSLLVWKNVEKWETTEEML